MIVHGTALLMEKGHPEVGPIEELWTEIYGSSPFTLGEGVTLIRVEPEAVYTFAPDPSASRRPDPLEVHACRWDE